MASTCIDTSAHITDNHNNCIIRCIHCESRILSPSSATYVSEMRMLPTPTQKKNQLATTEEELSDWWLVEDMFIFDNIGFSHTVDNVKYLVCADCEQGPVGWHDVNSKKCFLALARVKHCH